VVNYQPSKLEIWVRFPLSAIRGNNSVGRVYVLHAFGQGFESPLLQKKMTKEPILIKKSIFGLISPKTNLNLSDPHLLKELAYKIHEFKMKYWAEAEQIAYGQGDTLSRKLDLLELTLRGRANYFECSIEKGLNIDIETLCTNLLPKDRFDIIPELIELLVNGEISGSGIIVEPISFYNNLLWVLNALIGLLF
jgi:hypothetical protein